LSVTPLRYKDDMRTTTGRLSEGMLARVRALLAKAESTTFEPEAEALTAKVQELMARYRIERALLDAGKVDAAGAPASQRMRVDRPYADVKAVLLAGIADANGCRAVWSKTLGSSTVFGFDEELAAVEELFTSLLVQAWGALQRAGSKRDQFGRSRTTRFRRSFLLAFALRIGQRLRATVDATVDDVSAATGTALVPLRAARAQAAERAARAAFPQTRGLSPTASDGEGWRAGTVFGDLADLSVAARFERRSA
jgi:hypothetical protein